MAPLTPRAFRLYAHVRTPFRGTRPYPDPPTLEQYKAAPMTGTEKILREAFAAKRVKEGNPLFNRKKIEGMPWVLDISFSSDEELWCFLDEMDRKELRRQRTKYHLKHHPNDQELKKKLFLFVKHQAYYAEEADRLMERRIRKANKRAEFREAARERRRLKLEQRVTYTSSRTRDDPFDVTDAWIPKHEVIDIGEMS